MFFVRVAIVIPAYNAQKRISNVLEECGKSLIKRHKRSAKIIVVADHGSDRTESVVAGYARAHKGVSLIARDRRQGKGAALIEGFSVACGDPKNEIVGFIDADASVGGEDMEKLIKRLEESEADGVIASRYVDGSRWIGKQDFARLVASRAYNALVRLLFGFPYADTQCGAKFFRRNSLRAVLRKLVLTDMSIDINILYEMQRLGLRIIEEPVTYRWNGEGSTLDLRKQPLQMMMVAIGYRIARSPLDALLPGNAKAAIYNFFRGM